MTPSAYRRGGRGAEIRYTVAASPLGTLLVAATGRGVCRISLGDAAPGLERDLRHEFPASTIRRDPGRLAAWVQRILRHLEGRAPHLDLPLDIRATAFQQRVNDAFGGVPVPERGDRAQLFLALQDDVEILLADLADLLADDELHRERATSRERRRQHGEGLDPGEGAGFAVTLTRNVPWIVWLASTWVNL